MNGKQTTESAAARRNKDASLEAVKSAVTRRNKGARDVISAVGVALLAIGLGMIHTGALLAAIGVTLVWATRRRDDKGGES